MSVDTPTRAAEAPVEEPKKFFGMTLTPAKKGGARKSGGSPLVVGGAPRANLLPPEIILKRTQLKMRRSLRFGVVVVAIATVAGCLAAAGVSAASQVQLAASVQEQAAIATAQLEYAEVREVNDTIVSINAGQEVGGSTEIAWRDYLVALQATLPAGVVLDSVSITSGTPMTLFAPSDAPLQGDRVAELSFTAMSPTLPSIPDWLRSLTTLTGYVDASPGSVTFADGQYTADVVMHINADAFSKRFDPATIAAADAEDSASGDTAVQEGN